MVILYPITAPYEEHYHADLVAYLWSPFAVAVQYLYWRIPFLTHYTSVRMGKRTCYFVLEGAFLIVNGYNLRIKGAECFPA